MISIKDKIVSQLKELHREDFYNAMDYDRRHNPQDQQLTALERTMLHQWIIQRIVPPMPLLEKITAIIKQAGDYQRPVYYYSEDRVLLEKFTH